MIFTWVGANIQLRYGYLVPYAIITFKAGFIVKALVLNFLRSLQEIFVNTTPSHPCFFVAVGNSLQRQLNKRFSSSLLLSEMSATSQLLKNVAFSSLKMTSFEKCFYSLFIFARAKFFTLLSST